MNSLADIEDSRTRDRRLCRPGRRRALATALAILAALVLLGRMAPPEEPATVRRPPRWVWILPGTPAEAALADVRAVRTPTAFALPTATGFTSPLRALTPRLAPPMRPDSLPSALAAAFPLSSAPDLPDWISSDFAIRAPASAASSGWKPVFANRRPPPDIPRIEFTAGWEPRLFSGIDLSYPDWAPGTSWTASADIRFDARGIPLSVLLDRPSGIPGVDRQLARSAAAWRLLDPDAPRHGEVTWCVPVPSPAAQDSLP